MVLFELFVTFFKIGLFTIGGGYAMMPLIQQEVMNNGWMTNAQLIDFIAVSESTPGPFAVNISTFVGMTRAGFAGAFCATLGVVLPSVLVTLLVAKFFTKYIKHPIVRAAFSGIRPAVVGLIGAAALSVLLTSVIGISNAGMLLFFQGFPTINWDMVALVAIVFVISRVWKKLHPIWLIAISGLLGIVNNLIFNAARP